MMKYWAAPPAPPKPPRQGYRPGKSDGVLIAWTVLCGIWSLGAFAGGSEDNGYGFAIMFVIWVIPAFWLTIIYLDRPRRPSPLPGLRHPRHDRPHPVRRLRAQLRGRGALIRTLDKGR